ncbi:RNA-directed DNA polymerase [Arachis hypogaea]|nr:RNA-directed DNA polymerase [Arachis hypogaea]
MNVFRHKRGLAVSDLCNKCDNEPQSMLHCLQDCSIARDVWNYLDPSIVEHANASDFRSWITSVVNGKEEVVTARIWWIWWNSCNHFFNLNEPWLRRKISCLARALMNELKRVKNVLKVNCDASVLSDSLVVGFRCVIRDHYNTWMLDCSRCLSFDSVFRNELLTARNGLIIVWKVNCDSLICETDSMKVYLLLTILSTMFRR